jgi:hypothetical protein
VLAIELRDLITKEGQQGIDLSAPKLSISVHEKWSTKVNVVYYSRQ